MSVKRSKSGWTVSGSDYPVSFTLKGDNLHFKAGSFNLVADAYDESEADKKVKAAVKAINGRLKQADSALKQTGLRLYPDNRAGWSRYVYNAVYHIYGWEKA